MRTTREKRKEFEIPEVPGHRGAALWLGLEHLQGVCAHLVPVLLRRGAGRAGLAAGDAAAPLRRAWWSTHSRERSQATGPALACLARPAASAPAASAPATLAACDPCVPRPLRPAHCPPGNRSGTSAWTTEMRCATIPVSVHTSRFASLRLAMERHGSNHIIDCHLHVWEPDAILYPAASDAGAVLPPPGPTVERLLQEMQQHDIRASLYSFSPPTYEFDNRYLADCLRRLPRPLCRRWAASTSLDGLGTATPRHVGERGIGGLRVVPFRILEVGLAQTTGGFAPLWEKAAELSTILCFQIGRATGGAVPTP